jgi:hypothetical protein
MAGERAEQALKAWRKAYREARRRTEKMRILDEAQRVTGYHRKYLIMLMNRGDPRVTPRRREKKYGHRVVLALKALWEMTGYLWSLRLKAAIPLWLPSLRRRVPWITKEEEEALCRISARQMDRVLAPYKKNLKRRRYGHTKPGFLLRHDIPVRGGNDDIRGPGSVEADLVAHCGNTYAGEFCYSLNITDIMTGWCETRAILGKSEQAVTAALNDMRKELPFPLSAFDSDNGSEFINRHMVKYCEKHHITFTRSRPYKKDDNAHIEQKNWTHVRKLFGYGRFDTEQETALMNRIYRGPWRLLNNLFLPSVKLIRKERCGSKIRRVYDRPRTPLDRLSMFYGENLPEPIRKLIDLRKELDSANLQAEVDAGVKKLLSMRKHPRPYEPVSLAHSHEEAYHARLR